MNKKLRLIVTRKCPRQCPGCCNKDYTHVDKIDLWEVIKYDELYITGGEPMLFPDKVERIIDAIRVLKPEMKIYIYTAQYSVPFDRGKHLTSAKQFRCFTKADGVTYTLHTDDDAIAFRYLNVHMTEGTYRTRYKKLFTGKSLRLNWFKDCTLPDDIDLSLWQVTKDKEWVEHCPIPDGEDLRELTTLW